MIVSVIVLLLNLWHVFYLNEILNKVYCNVFGNQRRNYTILETDDCFSPTLHACLQCTICLSTILKKLSIIILKVKAEDGCWSKDD